MKQAQIKSPCTIYKMNGNTCSVCNTLVHDVSNMSNEEIIELLSGSKKTCISAHKSKLKLTWFQVVATLFLSALVSCGISKKTPKSHEIGTGSYIKIDSTKINDTTMQIRGTGSFIKRY